nr:hypothetical protein CFP56_11448 [Quercus suber]
MAVVMYEKSRRAVITSKDLCNWRFTGAFLIGDTSRLASLVGEQHSFRLHASSERPPHPTPCNFLSAAYPGCQQIKPQHADCHTITRTPHHFYVPEVRWPKPVRMPHLSVPDGSGQALLRAENDETEGSRGRVGRQRELEERRQDGNLDPRGSKLEDHGNEELGCAIERGLLAHRANRTGRTSVVLEATRKHRNLGVYVPSISPTSHQKHDLRQRGSHAPPARDCANSRRPIKQHARDTTNQTCRLTPRRSEPRRSSEPRECIVFCIALQLAFLQYPASQSFRLEAYTRADRIRATSKNRKKPSARVTSRRGNNPAMLVRSRRNVSPLKNIQTPHHLPPTSGEGVASQEKGKPPPIFLEASSTRRSCMRDGIPSANGLYT